MTRALVFFVAFFAAIAVPQIVAHGLNYLYPPQPRFGGNENALRATPAGFADPSLVFGASVRRELLQDARPVYPQVAGTTEVAQLGLTGDGGSVLAARFKNRKIKRLFSLTATIWSAQQAVNRAIVTENSPFAMSFRTLHRPARPG